MSKPKNYFVHGRFVDKNYNNDNEKPITYAASNYDITIEADDMKKAYDIAMEYMPAGSEIIEINATNRYPRGCSDSAF